MRILTLLPLMLLSAPLCLLHADDAEANAKVHEALEAERKGEYRTAAGLYEDADLLADDPQLKVNALKSAVMTYRKAGLLQSEFDTTEKLLNRHPSQTKYEKLVDRQFTIAKEYYDGRRDPAFWSLRWVPWLKGPDKTVEMLEKTLKRAPFSKQAPGARLRLAFKLNDEGKVKEAVEQLRILVRDYPNAPERKYAYLALGGMLFHLSQTGDGDGRYNREAISVLQEYQTLYPKSTEQEFVDKTLLQAKDVQAARLLGLAGYYKRTGRTEAAERYLNLVLRDYPDTDAAGASESMLVKLDNTYTPDGFRDEVLPRIPSYDKQGIPVEESKLLIIPENSNGRFLLPVYDLSNKKAPERTEDKDDDSTL